MRKQLPGMQRSLLYGIALVTACVILGTLSIPVAASGSGTITVMGRTYTLAEGQSWHGDLAVVGGTAHLLDASTLNGSISAVGGTVSIQGTVNGDIVGMGATIELGRDAVVNGDLVVMGTLRKHPDAQVRGDIVLGSDATRHLQDLPNILKSGIRPGTVRPPTRTLTAATRGVWRWFGWMLTLLIAAALAELLLAQNTERASATLTVSWIESFVAGLVTLIASALVIPLLVIICLGIPIAIVLGITLLLALLLGWVAVGKIVGTRLLVALRISAATPMIDTLVGVFLLSVLAAIPCLGSLFALAITAWGLGAVALTRFGAQAYPALPSSPASSARDDQPLHDTHPLDPARAPRQGDD